MNNYKKVCLKAQEELELRKLDESQIPADISFNSQIPESGFRKTEIISTVLNIFKEADFAPSQTMKG